MRLWEKQQIYEQLKTIDQRLAAAQQYVARNRNVRSSSYIHFSDWNGNSGHPLWMANVMMPTLMRARDQREKRLRAIVRKAKDRRLTERKLASAR